MAIEELEKENQEEIKRVAEATKREMRAEIVEERKVRCHGVRENKVSG